MHNFEVHCKLICYKFKIYRTRAIKFHCKFGILCVRKTILKKNKYGKIYSKFIKSCIKVNEIIDMYNDVMYNINNNK